MKQKDIENIDYLFEQNLSRLSSYVNQNNLDTIKMAFKDELKDINQNASENKERLLVSFLFRFINSQIQKAEGFRLLIEDMRKELSLFADKEEKEAIILEYSYRFSLDKYQQAKDKKAFERYFDEDALIERIEVTISKSHRLAIVALERIRAMIDLISKKNMFTSQEWDSFDMNTHFTTLLNYRQEPLLSHAIFKTFTHISEQIEGEISYIDQKLIRVTYQSALLEQENVWIQNDALEFLAQKRPDYFYTIAQKHFENYKEDESIFVRHKIASLSMKFAHNMERLTSFVMERILNDPSAYVRQAIVKSLITTIPKTLQELNTNFILKDADKSVRALALTQLLHPEITQAQKLAYRTLVLDALAQEQEPFVIKTALFCIKTSLENHREFSIDETIFMKKSTLLLTTMVQSKTTAIPIKRTISKLLAWLVVQSNEQTSLYYQNLFDFVQTIKVGTEKKIPKKLIPKDRELLYRILSVIAQEDFSLALRTNALGQPRLYRAERFKRKAWRILYEALHPSPDKREAFLHTIARVYYGTHHFPSTILAEQAPTKVPAEPYFIPQEESYRPFLPLPDHFVSSVQQPTLKLYPYHLYTSEGVTTITPPTNFFKRMWTLTQLTLGFAKIAQLRNWEPSFIEPPNAYIEKMRKIGFGVDFVPYQQDKSSNKFFSVGLLLPFIPIEQQEAIYNYFISAYENSLSDLVLFLGAIFAIFFLRHYFISKKIKQARENIPLSIGGWGTRGKSGTERIKAALFNGLGLKVFSKTTGNEAMFLHADSFQSMREMFLFRPYDKATIWEQANVIRLADKLDIDVFLWESMGLTPAYVEILQQRWMKDDIATITNTYPDHEDLQGPAGINIPQVMTNFIPYDSKLITTEEIMYPILKEYAKEVGTLSHPEGWLQAGLIAPDILSRFPYEEHPYNIALVLGVARELDIDEDEALKAMADYIVPDLGVLKAYPPAKYGTKTLSFINGMSANERFGALGNWNRMGLGSISDENEPHIFLTTVINNRADRVSRSKVFASMIVENIVADMHVLIGSNLSGFQNYMYDAWQSYQHTLSLAPTPEQTSQEILIEYAKNFRIIRSQSMLQTRLSILLSPLNLPLEEEKSILDAWRDIKQLELLLASKEEILRFYKEAKEQYDIFLSLEVVAQEPTLNPKLDTLFKEHLWQWLKKRLLIINNYHASGEEVIQIIHANTPVGMHNKMIGMQNIKGTGLDFAYRWVAWNNCFEIAEKIKEGNHDTIRKSIDALANFSEYGLLSLAYTQQMLEIAKNSIATQNEYTQSQIKIIETQLQITQEKIETTQQNATQMDKPHKQTWYQSLWSKTLETIEEFLDAGDAVKRRKKADGIYKDLVNHHISHKRASIELQKITKRQKGGWFVQKYLSK